MSNSKDNRIKKLKKQRIWPSILGLFFIVLIFGILMVAQIGVNGLNVIESKLMEGMSQTEIVSVLFEEYEEENKQDIQDTILTYIEVMPQIEAVWVVDSNGDKVWANGEMAPDTENSNEFSLDGRESISLIIEDELQL